MKSHPRGHYQNETSEGGPRGAVQSFCETQRLLITPERRSWKVLSYNHLPQPFLLACMLSHFSRVRLFATPWTVACQGPLSMEFSRPEYWSGLPCPPPGDLPDSGIESCFLHLYIGKQILDQSSHLRSLLVLYSVQFSRSVVSDSL